MPFIPHERDFLTPLMRSAAQLKPAKGFREIVLDMFYYLCNLGVHDLVVYAQDRGEAWSRS